MVKLKFKFPLNFGQFRNGINSWKFEPKNILIHMTVMLGKASVIIEITWKLREVQGVEN